MASQHDKDTLQRSIHELEGLLERAKDFEQDDIDVIWATRMLQEELEHRRDRLRTLGA